MADPLPPLTVQLLQKEAAIFAVAESQHAEPSLFGVTDGKAIGTYLEHKFQTELLNRYAYPKGSSAKGIDFPGLDVDIKVTSFCSLSHHVRSRARGKRSMGSVIRSSFLCMTKKMMKLHVQPN